jgi:hypothetical protein
MLARTAFVDAYSWWASGRKQKNHMVGNEINHLGIAKMEADYRKGTWARNFEAIGSGLLFAALVIVIVAVCAALQ